MNKYRYSIEFEMEPRDLQRFVDTVVGALRKEFTSDVLVNPKPQLDILNKSSFLDDDKNMEDLDETNNVETTTK